MRRRHRISFVLCVALSLAAHGTLLYTARRYWGAPPVLVVHKDPEPRPTIEVPDVPPPRPPPPQFGEHGGTGQSINSSEADPVQTAPKAMNDQAAWTRDPTGQRPGAPANPSPRPLSEPVTAPPPKRLPTPPPSPAIAPRMDDKSTPTDGKDTEQNQQKEPQPPQQQPQPPKPPQPRPSPQRPPTPAGGGRPIPHSDRDSDLFAKTASVEYQAGRVVASNGREVKFTRPREDLAALVDSAMISVPAKLLLSVSVDENGKVRDVVVLNSSGSSSIDRAFELATYASWFEPAKDADGKPMRDVFEFSIVLD